MYQDTGAGQYSIVVDKMKDMDDDNIDILDGSQYYESNGEIFCIDN